MIKQYYDTDCSTWSPQGKLFQVEYAMEAVKQGSLCLGLRSKTNVVLCSLKRSPSELACFQEKTFKIDDQIGMVMAGLTADARKLCKFMRTECLNYKYVYESNHPVNRLVQKVADKSAWKTLFSDLRPFGVGLLIAGYDQDGPHLFETCPSGNYYEFNCYAIGARSQSGRTYFEHNQKYFANSSLEQLILHGVKAIKKATQDDEEITQKSIEIAYVGPNEKFVILKQSDIDKYIKMVDQFNPENQMEIQQQ